MLISSTLDSLILKKLSPTNVISGISWQCSDCQRKFASLAQLTSHIGKETCVKLKRKRESKVNPEDLLKNLPGIRTKVVKAEDQFINLPGIPAEVVKKSKTGSRAAVVRSEGRKRQTNLKIEENKFFFLCAKCPQIFSTQALLDAHSSKCTELDFGFFKKSPAKSKKSESEPYHFDNFKNMYICSQCNDEFNFKSEVDEHLRTRHSRFTCNCCSQDFNSLMEFAYHSAEHNKTSTMTCPCCSFQTDEKLELTQHMESEHWDASLMTVKDLSLECVVCNKIFYDSRKLIHHQKNYHKAIIDIEPSMGGRLNNDGATKSRSRDRLLCDMCGKDFLSKYRLERHQRAMHEEIKPYVCKYCQRAFTGKDTMQKHERIHTGEKPYSCEYCGKCFRQPGPFSVHLRTHTGERPYRCKYCDKGFITNQMKKSHMKNCIMRISDNLITQHGQYVLDVIM
ncbi:hypothetical protein YQE_06776, partial [Dendroctonus ponderosae]